jgi:hypothetical protein
MVPSGLAYHIICAILLLTKRELQCPNIGLPLSFTTHTEFGVFVTKLNLMTSGSGSTAVDACGQGDLSCFNAGKVELFLQ